MEAMGVFNSCETVAIKFVLAKSSSLKGVMFFKTITCPITCCCFSPVGVIVIVTNSFSK